MVNYKLYDVKDKFCVRVLDSICYDPSLFNRTYKNLRKMVSEGRKCVVVSPEKTLDSKEIEEYRKFFCKKAKQDGVNYIYFGVPVEIGNV